MTPGARVAAAITVLAEILDGAPAERSLTQWGRNNRYAGSKDRAAVRDFVFDVLRNLQAYQSSEVRSEGVFEGRDVMIGCVAAQGLDVDEMFTGAGYAPPVLTDEERSATRTEGADSWNLQTWLQDAFVNALGQETGQQQARALSGRAPVSLRVNTAKTTRDELIVLLNTHGFSAHVNPLATTALTLDHHGRGLAATPMYLSGLFELQDAASQAVTEALAISQDSRVLDFCAGGGGKTLAMAARTKHPVTAHDADPSRMKDLENRADRAGVRCRKVTKASDLEAGAFDLVMLDAPCSGSGSWRRAPDAKWRLTEGDLAQYQKTQAGILQETQRFVAAGGTLAYATCSLLDVENETQINTFLQANPSWELVEQRRWHVSDDGDGFFLAQLKRK